MPNIGDSHLLQNGQWVPNPDYRPDITGVNSGRAAVPTDPGTGYTPAASWFGAGQSPYANATGIDITGGGVDPSGNTPVTRQLGSGMGNYITPEVAQQIAKAMGANLVKQSAPGGDFGPAGGISAPLFALDFGNGDPQSLQPIVAGLQRGDSLQAILSRVQAGINPGGVALPRRMDPRGNYGTSQAFVPGAQYGGQRAEWPTEWRKLPGTPAPPASPRAVTATSTPRASEAEMRTRLGLSPLTGNEPLVQPAAQQQDPMGTIRNNARLGLTSPNVGTQSPYDDPQVPQQATPQAFRMPAQRWQMNPNAGANGQRNAGGGGPKDYGGNAGPAWQRTYGGGGGPRGGYGAAASAIRGYSTPDASIQRRSLVED